MTQLLELGNKTDTPGGLAWLELLPDGFELPAGYVDAHRARAELAERHNEVGRLIADRETRLRDAVPKVSDPLDFAGWASPVLAELAGLREYSAHLPAPAPYDTQDDVIAEALARRLPDLGVGVPPLAALDLIHHVEAHAADGAQVPRTNDADLEALEFFEASSAAAADLDATARALRVPLAGAPIAGRVQAWAAFMPKAERHAGAMRNLRAIIDAADRKRIADRLAHSCPRWAGAHCGGDPVPAHVRWTFDAAAAGRIPHRPVHASSGPAEQAPGVLS